MKSKKSKCQDEFMAAATGDLEWLKQSLRDKESKTDYDENGLSALHLASIHGRFECLRYLIEDLKIDVNWPSANGWRPIHLCINSKIGKRSLQTLLYLIHKGANLSICNEDLITPIHQAANEGHYDCLKQLIESGGNFSSKDHRGNRPIDLAKLWGHKHCAKLLATHSWHQDKSEKVKEKYELKKSEIREILGKLENNFQISPDKRYTGSQAFYKWLEENTGDKAKKKKPVDKDGEKQLKELEVKKYVENLSNRKSVETFANHSDIWKYSNPNPQYFHQYPGNLRDIYPRHPYTLQPFNWSSPSEINPQTLDIACKLLMENNQNLIRKVAKERDKIQEKKRPPKSHNSSSNRLMYYTNDSVLDLPRKHTPNSAIMQKTNDSIFCLSDDMDSFLFRSAISFPYVDDDTHCPSTASTELDRFMAKDCRSSSHQSDIMSIEY